MTGVDLAGSSYLSASAEVCKDPPVPLIEGDGAHRIARVLHALEAFEDP